MPRGPGLAPSIDLPPRGLLAVGLLLLLAIDILLVSFLGRAEWIVLAAAVAAVVWLTARNLAWAVAFLAVGYPMMEPVHLAFGSERPGFHILRAILILAVGVFFFTRVQRPGKTLGRAISGPVFVLAALFGGVLLLGSLWTPSPAYARLKAIAYGSTNLLLLFCGTLLARTHDGESRRDADARIDRFLIATAVFALLLSLAGLLNLRLQYYPVLNRLSVLGINSIWIARICALGIFALVVLRRLRRVSLGTAAPIAAAITVVLVLTGSRGPMLGIFLALGIWLLAQTPRAGGRRLWVVALLLVVAAIGLLAMPDILRERFLRPFRGDASDFVRLGLARVAREALAQVSVLGMGTGGFSQVLRMGDIRAYPHNLFVEVFVENGLPGITVLLGWIGAVCVRGIRMRNDPRALALFLAFLFALWNAQFSGDLIANEWIWLFAGLLAGRFR